MYFRI